MVSWDTKIIDQISYFFFVTHGSKYLVRVVLDYAPVMYISKDMTVPLLQSSCIAE